MKKEWKNTVYLARSRIQGLGLYASRDIEMNSMIIEYKGEVIRSEVSFPKIRRQIIDPLFPKKLFCRIYSVHFLISHRMS